MDTTDWVNDWKAAMSRSPSPAGADSASRWTGFWDVLAERYLQESIEQSGMYRDIIEYLKTESVYDRGDSVLDIGCGPGTYSLLFSEDAGTVDALDSSERMIAVLTEEARRRGLHNLRPILSKWEDYFPDTRYGLVFSGMSPAIHDADTLFRMEQWATRGCCVVTYGESYVYPVVQDLWEMLMGTHRSANAYLYTYPLGVLRQKGRSPSVHMFNMNSRKKTPIGEMVDRYTRYFSIFTGMDEEKIQRIRGYFTERAREGIFEHVTQMKLAAICWKVSENR